MTCCVQLLPDNLVLQYGATLVGGESSSAHYGVLKIEKLKQVPYTILYFKGVNVD